MSLVHIDPPALYVDDEYEWTVIGDLRRPHSGWDDENYKYSDEVVRIAKDLGLRLTADPESSCSFFFCPDEDTAKRLAEIIEKVVPPMWGSTYDADAMAESLAHLGVFF